MTAQILYLVRTPLAAWNEWNRLQREVQANPSLALDWDHLNRREQAKERAFGITAAELRRRG